MLPPTPSMPHPRLRMPSNRVLFPTRVLNSLLLAVAFSLTLLAAPQNALADDPPKDKPPATEEAKQPDAATVPLV